MGGMTYHFSWVGWDCNIDDHRYSLKLSNMSSKSLQVGISPPSSTCNKIATICCKAVTSDLYDAKTDLFGDTTFLVQFSIKRELNCSFLRED